MRKIEAWKLDSFNQKLRHFSGIKDKNGRDIYVDDIILCRFDSDVEAKRLYSKVIYNINDGDFEVIGYKHGIECNYNWGLSAVYDIEVVGNSVKE